MTRSITIVHLEAGGGHLATAQALSQVVALQRRPWKVTLVDLLQVLDPSQRLRRLTGIDPTALYNQRLTRGWTLGLGKELKLLQALIRLAHRPLAKVLQQHWMATEPDLVVSVIPNFNRVLRDSLATSLPGVPFVTVLTDMADMPPHFWIEPARSTGDREHIVCGTERALQQARALGHADTHLHLTSGMAIRPSFYAPRPPDRSAALQALGLDPGRPTGLVMFGGRGSAQMLAVAKALKDRQLILLCGSNAALVRRLRSHQASAAHAVFGHVDDVAGCMALADYFIGKPGPGCLTEAVHMGLPVITFENAATMPQERCNVQWLRDGGLGLVLTSPHGLGTACDSICAELPAWRRRVASVDNRAIFELPQVFESLLLASSTPGPMPWPHAAWQVSQAASRPVRPARPPSMAERHAGT